MGIGIGAYVSAGTNSEYKNANYSDSIDYNPTVKTKLSITEISIGTGYEILPGLKFGAAWRAAFINASYYSTTYVSAINYQMDVNIDKLSNEQYDGFKLSTQYQPSSKKWGVGFNY